LNAREPFRNVSQHRRPPLQFSLEITNVLLLSRDQSDQFARITGTLLRVYGGRE
jgi:hypothetical protein